MVGSSQNGTRDHPPEVDFMVDFYLNPLYNNKLESRDSPRTSNNPFFCYVIINEGGKENEDTKTKSNNSSNFSIIIT